ncbi:reverse transcriptase [Phytophthora megakarya]|uniref:Reverse transcriptase n=1 Tax=Phytophthora megakarya TaxID=4795 RepID=A0A225VG84_9STRA|nr:reverse transcriptase [Phytophthora megakarya]
MVVTVVGSFQPAVLDEHGTSSNDARPRRPDYAVKTINVTGFDVARTYTSSSSLLDKAKAAYAHDADAKQLIEFLSAPSNEARRKLAPHLQASAHRYRLHDGLLFYSDVDGNADRIVVPNDPDLRTWIMYEYHDVPTTGHPGHEKTYSLLTRDFNWNHQYKWVAMIPAPHSQAPLQTLLIPSGCWESVLMDFVYGLPRNFMLKTGIGVLATTAAKWCISLLSQRR